MIARRKTKKIPPADLPVVGYVRRKQLLRVVPLSVSTLYRLMQEKKFPRPVRLAGSRLVGWRVEQVRAWMEERNQQGQA